MSKEKKSVESVLRDYSESRNAALLLILSRSWVNFVTSLTLHRRDLEKRIEETDEFYGYDFWMRTNNSLNVLHGVLRAHYGGKKLNVSRLAKEISTTRVYVSQLLKAARDRDLLDKNNKPTTETMSVVFDLVVALLENETLMDALSDFDARSRLARSNRADFTISNKSLRGAR